MKKTQLFNEVPIKKVKRSFFELSHEVKMSGKFSYLYPVLLQDCLPGDTFRNTSTIMMRLAPMLAPIMHRVNVTTHFFFVPNRLIHDGWEEFITGGQNGDSIVQTPYLTPAGVAGVGAGDLMEKGSLWDYMGLPVAADGSLATSTEQISLLPFLAYSQVWNDYYRDPNFDDELTTFIGGGDSSALIQEYGVLRARGWSKDYFTAALPFAQRGANVLIPLAGSINVVHDAPEGGDPSPAQKYLGTGPIGFDSELFTADSFNPMVNGQAAWLQFENSEITINDLRTSVAIQTWLENNARGGARYIEQIRSHFDTTVPDYRLDRAEYLGGGKQPIQISEVLANTSADDQPLGDMGGHGISVGKSNQFSYRCVEHGWIIGIMSVTPEPAYQQGIERMWSRQERFDYAWPELANLGEQEIKSKELFYSFLVADDDDNNDTFGYIPRYSEYKFKNDRVAGDFRDTLAFWHLGRRFLLRPSLNAAFTTTDENGSTVEETMRRIFAVQDGTDYLWIDIFHKFTAKRPLPYFGVPRLNG